MDPRGQPGRRRVPSPATEPRPRREGGAGDKAKAKSPLGRATEAGPRRRRERGVWVRPRGPDVGRRLARLEPAPSAAPETSASVQGCDAPQAQKCREHPRPGVVFRRRSGARGGGSRARGSSSGRRDKREEGALRPRVLLDPGKGRDSETGSMPVERVGVKWGDTLPLLGPQMWYLTSYTVLRAHLAHYRGPNVIRKLISDPVDDTRELSPSVTHTPTPLATNSFYV